MLFCFRVKENMRHYENRVKTCIFLCIIFLVKKRNKTDRKIFLRYMSELILLNTEN